ncbi:hypothetical protein V6N11_009374 [Hibiscus sabdariffa]|uniref:Secreted protein n=1 Tax=Hibiscus sabdariffa TaxID=183260 RepID=A0ABR2NSP6_9ROSI
MIWVPRRLGLAAGLGPLVSIPGQRVHVLYSPVQCGLNWFPVRVPQSPTNTAIAVLPSSGVSSTRNHHHNINLNLISLSIRLVRECGNKAAVGIKVKDGSCSGVGLSPSDRG